MPLCRTHILAMAVALVAAAAALLPVGASAFDTSVYARRSELAEGHWVKVSVQQTGMHFIPASDLRKWGFPDPARVTVHGCGARDISDHLTLDNYTDDLPQTPCERTASGIYFYAEGPDSWTDAQEGRRVHSLNPFSLTGYYFLTDSAEPLAVEEEGFATDSPDAAETYTATTFHEQELVRYAESGRSYAGEDFRYSPRQTFDFRLPGWVEGTTAWVKVSFMSRTAHPSSLSLSADGAGPAVAEVPATTGKNYGMSAVLQHTVVPSGTSLRLELAFSSSGTVHAANLDAIDINYTSRIALEGSQLCFTAGNTAVRLATQSKEVRVWDVSNPHAIKSMKTVANASGVAWVNAYTGERRYAAWIPSSDLPRPTFTATVANQDLHGDLASNPPDMVVFAPRQLMSAARRLAALHGPESDNPLEVMVVNQDDVFNEFSSGVRHFGAFRRMLKMAYDMGNSSGRPLRYAMMFGQPTADNRAITASSPTLMPTWQSAESLHESESYTTDDYLALLDDGTGLRPGNEPLAIAVGRIPARSVADASAYIDKLKTYLQAKGPWKNRVLMLADDGDAARHLQQSERQLSAFMETELGSSLHFDKVYLDAYDLVGGTCTDARTRLHDALNEGVMWWNYIGHADKGYITGQNVMNYLDVSNLALRRYPVLYAATCSFLQWDGEEPSGAERLFFTQRGGVIGAISATRTVFMTDNGILSNAIGRYAFSTDASGRPLTLGEICRRAKNALTSDTNKLRYVMMGDPAMRLPVPAQRIAVDEICGIDPESDDPPVVMARQNVTVRGRVLTPGFDGTTTATLYDAEQSVTTLGRDVDGTDGLSVVFEQQGPMLWTGCDTVAASRFEISFAMPSEIADNFRPAELNLYAIGSDGSEAGGSSRSFYIAGYDDTSASDTVPPVIEYAWLNHESFADGATVNESPMLLARVSDNVGLNLSSSGIGHRMTLTLDSADVFTDVSRYFTPASDGTPAGTIAYPLSDLSAGNHTLGLKVWDTNENSATSTLSFFVEPGLQPEIFELLTDANPASTEANFYLRHNRPDAMLTATIEIYNMLGRLVWTTSVTDRSDMFVSAPITWPLTDLGGHRVVRGIYIVRASLCSPGTGQDRATATLRLAVTGK